MTDEGRMTYERATREYDAEFERVLIDAIMKGIAEASIVSDTNVMAIRTSETVGALVAALANTIALSPDADTPTALRKLVDTLAKQLRRQAMAVAANPDMRAFKRRAFHGPDVRGHA